MGTFIGSSLRLNQSCQNNDNQLAGQCAGVSVTTGRSNNFFGRYAGRNVTSGSFNIFFGCRAGCSVSTGGSNHFFGIYAGEKTTAGGSNIFIGSNTGRCNTTGSSNVFIGGTGQKSNSNWNVFIGFGGSGNCNTSGECNVFIGCGAGFNNTTGSRNTFLGRFAGGATTTGCNNLIFGSSSGNGTYGLACITSHSNRIIMGNCVHTCAQIKIGWTTVSDVRDKCIYGSIDRGLGFLKGINPIEYQFKDRETNEITDPLHKRRYGFSAQEILELEGNHPVIVSTDNPDKLQLTTDHLLPIMINAIKELSAEVDSLKERVAILEL